MVVLKLVGTNGTNEPIKSSKGKGKRKKGKSDWWTLCLTHPLALPDFFTRLTRGRRRHLRMPAFVPDVEMVLCE